MFDKKQLIANNAAWSAQKTAQQADYFTQLARGQSPQYLWIGCSDSRVPPTEILGLEPGDVFVHRNIANQANPVDLSCLSVLQFSIEYLKVRDIIVCGHTECGGVKAALSTQRLGLIDNWLRPIKEICCREHACLAQLSDDSAKLAKVIELNVKQQVDSLVQNDIVQAAWQRGQTLNIHGWVFDLSTGRVKDLGFEASGPTKKDALFTLS